MSNSKTFLNGLVVENPTFVLLLGMCPTLAVTTSLSNGIGMGLSATAVLIGSNVVISAMRRLIPPQIRIASFIVIIAGFVTLIEMLLQAYLPDISSSLGLFIPLIVVNCIILARAEAFASKNGVMSSAIDGAGMGLGFTAALSLIGAIREVLGSGTFLGMQIFGDKFVPAIIMILPPGAFITLGILIAVKQLISAKSAKGKVQGA